MKVTMFYRPNSENSRQTEEYIKNIKNVNPDIQIEAVNYDSKDALGIIRLHDILEHPALLISNDQGQAIKMWQGINNLPLFSEVSYYYHQ